MFEKLLAGAMRSTRGTSWPRAGACMRAPSQSRRTFSQTSKEAPALVFLSQVTKPDADPAQVLQWMERNVHKFNKKRDVIAVLGALKKNKKASTADLLAGYRYMMTANNKTKEPAVGETNNNNNNNNNNNTNYNLRLYEGLYHAIKARHEGDAPAGLLAPHIKLVWESLRATTDAKVLFGFVCTVAPADRPPTMFSELLRIFTLARDNQAMERVVAMMVEEDLLLPAYSLRQLIVRCAHDHDHEMMWKHHAVLEAQGHKGSPRMYSFMMTSLHMGKDFEGVNRCWDLMKAHKVPVMLVSYDMTIAACYKLGLVDKLDLVLGEVHGTDLIITEYAYSMGLHARCISVRGQRDSAYVLELAEIALQHYPQCETLYRDVITWSAKLDNGSLVEEYVSRFEAAGGRRTAGFFNLLIYAYSKLGRRKAMLGEFEEMKRRELEPTHHTYTTIIKHFANKGELEQVLPLYEEAQERLSERGFQDTGIQDVALYGYIKANQPELCVKLYESMKTDGEAPNKKTIDILMRMCTTHPQGDFWQQLLSDMGTLGITPDSRLLRTISMYLVSAGSIEHAVQLMQQVEDTSETDPGHLALFLRSVAGEEGHSEMGDFWRRKLVALEADMQASVLRLPTDAPAAAHAEARSALHASFQATLEQYQREK